MTNAYKKLKMNAEKERKKNDYKIKMERKGEVNEAEPGERTELKIEKQVVMMQSSRTD